VTALLEPVPGVLMLQKTWGSNIYLIPGRSTTLIDAGFPLDERRIIKALDETGLGMIVATHYHIDHVGTISALKRRFGTEVAAHTTDAAVMEGKVPYRVYKLDPLRTVYYKVLSPLYKYEFVEVDTHLEEGSLLDVLGGLEVIHLPGHTEGSIGLYQPDRGILFSGDTIRNERNVLEGPPPNFSVDVREAFTNLEEKLLKLDFDVLLPGHGEPVLGGARRAVERLLLEAHIGA
jgi:glyoxylase-like metal-dependent hydrolase (beta-lactamase superfamily II)